MNPSTFLNNLISEPGKIFLLDAGGAVLSTFMLGIILPAFQPFIGMPVGILYLLSIIPLIYLIYDLIIYWLKPSGLRIFILIIAILNLAYCALSVFLLYRHWYDLTTLGKAYFIGECMIIVFIVQFEWVTAKKLD